MGFKLIVSTFFYNDFRYQKSIQDLSNDRNVKYKYIKVAKRLKDIMNLFKKKQFFALLNYPEIRLMLQIYRDEAGVRLQQRHGHETSEYLKVLD